jgi:hypothetical protein
MNLFLIYTDFIDINNIKFIRFLEILNIFNKLKYNVFLLTKYNNWNKLKLYELKNSLKFNNIFIYDNLQFIIDDINLNYQKNILINFNENILNFDNIINIPEYNISLNNSKTNIINEMQQNIYDNTFYFPFNTDKIIINNNYLGNPTIISNNIDFINYIGSNINNKKINLYTNIYLGNIKNKYINIIESDSIQDLINLFILTPFVMTDTLFNLNLSYKYNIPVLLYNNTDFIYEYQINEIDKLLYYYNDFYDNRDMCKYIGENTKLNFKNDIINFRNYINTIYK